MGRVTTSEDPLSLSAGTLCSEADSCLVSFAREGQLGRNYSLRRSSCGVGFSWWIISWGEGWWCPVFQDLVPRSPKYTQLGQSECFLTDHFFEMDGTTMCNVWWLQLQWPIASCYGKKTWYCCFRYNTPGATWHNHDTVTRLIPNVFCVLCM